MKWAILLLGILCNASASVLIKLGITPPRNLNSISDFFSILNNWYLLCSLALYFIAFLLYAVALSRLPLNVAHPLLTSGAISVVALCSLIIFHETFYWTTTFGIFFVIVGVVMITFQNF
jgi:multidrug transporter EmrE-like cation transporter